MKKIIYLLPLAAALLFVQGCGQRDASSVSPAIGRDAEIEAKVEKVLKGMGLTEKVGQMVQLTSSTVTAPGGVTLDPEKLQKVIGEMKVGSILNTFGDVAQSRELTAQLVSEIQKKSMEEIGIPCIYGLDMIHGASYLTDGTFYPQEINLAATFNRE